MAEPQPYPVLDHLRQARRRLEQIEFFLSGLGDYEAWSICMDAMCELHAGERELVLRYLPWGGEQLQ